MKKLITILLILAPLSLYAQDRFIEIPEKDAPALKQYKINWHTGIDPVQIKDGRWVLPERVKTLIPANLSVSKDEKVEIADLKTYIEAQKIVTLTKNDFTESKEIEAEETRGIINR